MLQRPWVAYFRLLSTDIPADIAPRLAAPLLDGRRAQAGARAIVQPGGSMRDKEVLEAADRLGIAMVFTGTRHFRH